MRNAKYIPVERRIDYATCNIYSGLFLGGLREIRNFLPLQTPEKANSPSLSCPRSTRYDEIK